MNLDRVILLTGLGVLLIGWSLWPRLWVGAFYHAAAMGFLLLFICIRRLSTNDSFMYGWATCGMWLAANNLVDELFFDPAKFGINEYIVSAIIIIVTSLRVWRNKKKPRRWY